MPVNAASRLAPRPRGGLDLAMLAPSVHRYFQEGLAPSTRRSYESAMKKFYSFCDTYQVANPFLATEHLLCSFAAYMGDLGLSPQTIKSYLAGIRNMQLSLGLPDPREQSSLPILKRVQAGISRARIGSPTSRIRLPITPHLNLDNTGHKAKALLWAVCCTAFFGCFRLGNYCWILQQVLSITGIWPGVTLQLMTKGTHIC